MTRACTHSWILAAALLACSGKSVDGEIRTCESDLTLPASVKTDILFVIDNSFSMSEEQAKVVAQLNTFVTELANGPVDHDFQVGVVTTSISMNWNYCGATSGAVLDNFPDQSGRLQRGLLPPTEPVILSSSQVDLKDAAATATWLSKVKALITQGVEGSGQEMGLQAARLALSDLLSVPTSANPPGNQGFLRAGARLLVIILSDEDDCSVLNPRAVTLQSAVNASGVACGPSCATDAECGTEPGRYCTLVSPAQPSQGRTCQVNHCETREGRAVLAPVDPYIQFFKSIDDGTGSGASREVFLAVIGPVDASGVPSRCQQGTDEAYGIGERYKEAVDKMGENGLIASICNADYGSTLLSIAQLVSAPHTVDLPQPPPDPKLLIIDLERQNSGGSRRCTVGNGFEYLPPAADVPARVRFTGDCRPGAGDKIAFKLACAS